MRGLGDLRGIAVRVGVRRMVPEVSIGAHVQVTARPQQRGFLRWDGIVDEERWLGIELLDMVPEGHDGTHPCNGQKYFKVKGLHL